MSRQVIRINDLASTPGKPGKLPVSPATIWRWVRESKFPKPYKIGACVTVFDLEAVEAWLETQKSNAPRNRVVNAAK